MTLDEQYQFMMERPTPTTPWQINSAWLPSEVPKWIDAHQDKFEGDCFPRWKVRWKPELKTVLEWPPVKPYWVKYGGTGKIVQATGFYGGQVLLGNTWNPLHALEHDLWTDDLNADPVVWYPFTREIEE